MAAADEERPLGTGALVFERIAAIRILALRHGLEQGGHGGAEQFRQMGAALDPAELALNHFAPSAADALADQPLQDRFDLDAGRIGRRPHRRLRFANRHALIDGETQGDIVHGIAGPEFLAVAAGALGEGFGIPQARLDFPQPVVAEIAVAFDRARMHVAAPGFVAAIFGRHSFSDPASTP